MKSLCKKIIKQLVKKKLIISTAESCTGGLLSSSIISISGSSKVFNLGLIVYSNKSKNRILKVPKKILKKYGAVSNECCLSMVNNLQKICKSDISISITGIAGPAGALKNKPVGLVFIGLKKYNKTIVNKYLFRNKNRNQIQKAAVKKSLELILSIIK